MSNHFVSPNRRLVRAKRHIENVKAEIKAFLDAQPYASVIERNANGFDEHKAKLVRDIPHEVTDLAYEAIEGLRSALDQATYSVSVLCGANRPDLIHFPIANDAADLEKILSGKYIKHLPPEILTFFRDLKPYKGGNDIIWALNRIRRQGVHRLLVPVGTASSGMQVINMSFNGPFEIHAPVWNSQKNEIIFAITGPGSQLKYNINLALFVAFGEVEGVAGQSVVPTLEVMAKEVDRILAAIEAECWVIGIIK